MSFERPTNRGDEGKAWTMAEAIAEIGLLRQMANQGGSVDSEHDELSRLIIDVQNEKIPPKEAVLKAHTLMQSRQDYH